MKTITADQLRAAKVPARDILNFQLLTDSKPFEVSMATCVKASNWMDFRCLIHRLLSEKSVELANRSIYNAAYNYDKAREAALRAHRRRTVALLTNRNLSDEDSFKLIMESSKDLRRRIAELDENLRACYAVLFCVLYGRENSCTTKTM